MKRLVFKIKTLKIRYSKEKVRDSPPPPKVCFFKVDGKIGFFFPIFSWYKCITKVLLAACRQLSCILKVPLLVCFWIWLIHTTTSQAYVPTVTRCITFVSPDWTRRCGAVVRLLRWGPEANLPCCVSQLPCISFNSVDCTWLVLFCLHSDVMLSRISCLCQ